MAAITPPAILGSLIARQTGASLSDFKQVTHPLVCRVSCPRQSPSLLGESRMDYGSRRN